jgi:hypothetical protein
MATLTLLQALEQAEVLARQTLAPEAESRISCAVAIIKNGGIHQRDNGTWEVESQSEPGQKYIVNGGCSCDDAHYRGGHCKHKIASLLIRKAHQLMQQPPQSIDTVAPPPPVETAPLYEAPASCNVRVLVAGHEVQFTLRGEHENDVFARLQALLARKDVRPLPPKPQPRQQWRKPQGRS